MTQATHVDPARKEKASVVEDLIDIFYTPSTVFERRSAGGFWIPALIVTACIGLLFIGNSAALEPIFEAEYARAAAATMRANPQLTPEMMERGRQFAMMGNKIGAFVFVPIAMVLIGFVLWIVGKLFDAKQTLAAALMVAAYSYVPRVLDAISLAVQGFLVDTSKLTARTQLSLGAARFLDPDTASPVLVAFLTRIDVFTIWVTVLLAIGLSVTGKIPRAKAAIAAAVVWLIGAGPGLFGAMRMQQ